MASTYVKQGIFNVLIESNGEIYTQKVGFIRDNVLDSGSSDTAAVATDLFSAGSAIANLTQGGLSEVNVDYTVRISS